MSCPANEVCLRQQKHRNPDQAKHPIPHFQMQAVRTPTRQNADDGRLHFKRKNHEEAYRQVFVDELGGIQKQARTW